MKKIAIIPARGGSKRIPRKNIKEFFGKPIIAYSIETALNCNLFNEVMVSTDDSQIASVAKKFGANVPFIRSEKNSSDFATLNDVIREVLEKYKTKGINFELGCCILPTCPLLQKKFIKRGLGLLVREDFESVRPIVRFSYPIQRALYLSKDNYVTFANEGYKKIRSQDLRPTYHDAGQFYWFYTKRGLNSKKCGGFEISELEAQDVDTEEDWKLLVIKYNLLKNK